MRNFYDGRREALQCTHLHHSDDIHDNIESNATAEEICEEMMSPWRMAGNDDNDVSLKARMMMNQKWILHWAPLRTVLIPARRRDVKQRIARTR